MMKPLFCKTKQVLMHLHVAADQVKFCQNKLMIRIPPENLTFIRVLGKGGCGEVYLAESKTLGKVAVKKMLIEGEDQIIQEFLNEAELLSKMNSPYIVRFFGTSRNKEGECIVMEYATNGTLFHFLEFLRKNNNESTFSWDQRYQMAQDITRGLLLMHSQGVLHRDMKSLNVLLDKDMTAKISDFGLSKIKTKSQTISSSLYVQNNVFGSLLWKAPETFSKDNPYTAKADIYALGMIFWEIASCQAPYDKWEQQQILFHVFSGNRLDIPSTCPAGFKDLIKFCWHQEPKQRPTASNVFDKISQLIAQIPKIDSSVPQVSGNIPDLGISLPEEHKQNLIGSDPKQLVTDQNSDFKIGSTIPKLSGIIPDREISITEELKTMDPNSFFSGSHPDRLVTDNQSTKKDGESEIERKIRLALEKQQFLILEKKKREEEEQRTREEIENGKQRIEKETKEMFERKKKAEEERFQMEKGQREEEKRKQEEQQQRKLEDIEKENKRIEKEMKEVMDRKKKAEEERIQLEKRLQEETERIKQDLEKEVGDLKQKEWFERIEKWKSTIAPDFEGNIFEAAAKGKLRSIIYLLAHGTNVNKMFPQQLYDVWWMTDCAPLHFSARYGHLSVVEYLVDQKADINAKDNGGWTPLHYAAANGQLNVVEYLVNQKADINAKDVIRKTPLHWAAEKDHFSIVENLLHHGADFRDGIKGQNYLHWAVEKGHLGVVECLVNQKADINAKDECD